MKLNFPWPKNIGISTVFYLTSKLSFFYKLNTAGLVSLFLLSVYFSQAQCSYTGSPLTQVGSTYTFCVDNGTTYTSATVNSGQYVMVNVVKGFTYTFSVGNVFTANENLTILDASTNGNVSPATFASGASGATISNWVSSLSGQIKVLLSRGACSNANAAGGAITLTLNAVGNSQDSQTAFGTDQWVAHVYNWTGAPAPGGTSPSTPSTTTAPFTNASYVGYYNVGSESISETFGGDYNCFPVYSNGVVRTNMYTEQFAVRYRMRSTKTGCYSLATTGDDGVRVYVDGVKVYDEWKEQSPTSYSNILLYLNGNSTIIFDYYENGGQNVNSFSLTPFDGGSNSIAQSSVTVCSGISAGALNGSSYTYNGTATNPTISFQWQSSTDNVNFTNIAGATTEDYTPPTQTTATNNVVRYYRRIVTAAAATATGCTYTSNVATVITSPGVPAIPGAISGLTPQCPSVTGQTYSISAVTNTNSYNWTVPTGWTITGGAGTNSITVTTGTSAQNGNISVTAVNGCGSSTARTLAVTVNSNNTVSAASSTPTLCVNTALTAITHNTTGATGIGAATGLPAGVSAAWASNIITINGTPTASGTFTYSIPLIGGCANVNATGNITVNPNNTVGTGSSSPTLCVNTALTAITHTTTGATGIGTATGLPAGVTAGWASNTITITGTPTVSGTFNYSIPLTGGCGSVNAGGTITVNSLSVAPTGITGTTTICNGNSTTLTVSGGATGTGATVQWFTGSCGGTSAGTGNSITVSPSANTTYYVRYSGTCNTTTCASQLVTVNTPSVAPTGITGTTTICNGNSTTLTVSGGTTGTAATVQWFTGSCGGTSAGTGNSITVSPSANTTYYVRYSGACNTTSCASQLVTVNTPSVAPTAITGTTTICNGNSTTLTVSGGTTGTAATVQWFTGSCGGTSAGTGNSITVSPSANTTYYVRYSGACNTTSCASQLITVNATSAAAVISGSAAICLGSSANLQVVVTGGASPYSVIYSNGASNVTLNGYTSGSNISVTPTATTTYTLVSVTSANGCAGAGNSGSAIVSIDATTSTNGGISWSNGLPAAGKSVIFDGSTANLNADLSACSLRLANNAVVNVAPGKNITLYGKITVDSGSTFTLNNTANLIQNTTIANTGNIVVKRNSSALKRLDYTLWSSPVTGQGIYAFSPFTFANRFYVYNTATNLYNNPAVGLNVTNTNADGLNGIDNNNVQFAAGKGYLIRIPWDHPTAAAVWAGSFTGVPNNGTIDFAMATGYNAVGNPYPSRINVRDFINGNANISGPLYFWRKTNDTTSPSYATLTKTAYVANGAVGGDTGTGYFNSGNEANWVINIGQGFIVNATSSTNLTFTNSMRRSSNTDQFFKTAQPTANAVSGLYWLNLNAPTGIYSQTAVGYSSEATFEEDRGIDGRNINADFYLTSLIGTDEYSIQGRPDFVSSDVVPLSYKVTVAGTYTISIDHTAGLFSVGSQAIFVKDNLTSTMHNLQNGAYSFTSAVGTFNNRFEIIYQSQLSNPTFTANEVVIYSQNNDFVVNSGNTVMASVKVFDIRGRLLQEKAGISANQTVVNGGLADQVLLLQITSEDGTIVTKKVIK